MSDWLPIESAPMDGTHILVCLRAENFPERRALVHEAYWSARSSYWRMGTSSIHPTHLAGWMPLPEPISGGGGDNRP